VFPVSVDGGGLPEFPNPQRDNGLVQKLAIQQVPMLVLGNIKDKRLIPLASGVVSAQDVIERIYVLTSTRPGELY
jgi:conjugal transfer pilus assembly protein TraF